MKSTPRSLPFAAVLCCWTLSSPAGFAQPSEAFDDRLVSFEVDASGFGLALAVGDFDGDSYADLAVGEPYAYPESTGGGSGGRVSVYRGSPSGLLAPVRLEAQSTGLDLGWALAAGDFDDDGDDELVVGVPGANPGSVADAGEIRLFRWDGATLVAAGTFSQATAGVLGGEEAFDGFGSALAVGDFDDDGVDDLAVGVPDEDVGSAASAGAVHVLFGQTGVGLGTTGNQLLYQGNDGVAETSEAGDEFGFALAAGDFDCDGHDDLVIGIPGEASNDEEDAGIVLVLGGGADGLDPTVQNTVRAASYFGNSVEGGDRFGAALAAGHFFTVCADLLIGAPGDADAGHEDAGAVFFYSANQNDSGFWTEDGIGRASAVNEALGTALATGDFDGDGDDELVFGVPGQQVALTPQAGVALVLGLGGAALPGEPAVFWCRPGIATCIQPHIDDTFGAGVAAGDFNGDGLDDLAIAVPWRDLGENPNAGAVALLYSALFAEDFEGSDFGEWSDQTP